MKRRSFSVNLVAQSLGSRQAAVVFALWMVLSCVPLAQAASAKSKSFYISGSTSGTSQDAELSTATAEVDQVTVLVDSNGKPVFSQAKGKGPGKPGTDPGATAGNELTFTFNSELNPWSPTELAQLQTAIQAIYPVAKAVYGPPAFNLTVNVTKAATLSFSGEYNVSLNQIVLLDAWHADVLCHEMLHAFRDANMVGFSSFEEGMVRAAEIEIFNRLPQYDYPMGKHHSYTYDVYYEGLNRPSIGARNGNFFAGYVSPLLRYQLAGYAWGKALLENPGFLRAFNAQLYQQCAKDPSITSSETRLLGLLAAVQPSVEGKRFHNWYAQQGVLNMDPPRGYMLYNRMNQATLDFFFRGDDGQEIMLAGQSILRWIGDYQDAEFDSATELTDDFGFVSYVPNIPAGYVGRTKIAATGVYVNPGTSVQSLVTDVAYECVGCNIGVFGVVPELDAGAVEIIPLDAPDEPLTVELINGAFALPSMAAPRGRFVATVTDLQGRTVSRQFTKDASDYFLPLSTAALSTDIMVSQVCSKKQSRSGATLTYTITVRNLGSSAATDVLLVDSLPGGATLTGVSISNTVWSTWSSTAVPVNGVLTVNWESLAPGGSATVTVTLSVPSPVPAAISNHVATFTSCQDPNSGNNAALLTVSGGK